MSMSGILRLVMADSARHAFASHLAILRSCPDVISRLLKNRGSVLLAAKVLVVSRLLHTKLSQRSSPPPYLETLRDKLGSLRRRLLSRINGRFKRLDIARDVLVEAMCAFSLATSSSARDVLRHYYHMRQEAILENMGERTSGNENILVALRLYVKTLRDTQAVIPNQLANALEKLKSTSLIKSQGVRALTDLNLDIHEQWIDDDIKTFTPFIRYDDLSKMESERSLKQWAKKQFSSFLNGLRNSFEDVQDPSELMRLRRQVLESWLSNHQHSIGIDSAEALDGLRDVFNVQASRIVQNRTSELDRVGAAVEGILQDWQPGVSDLMSSLWESSMTSTGMTNGGKTFRESLSARSLGRNKPLSTVSDEYTIFLESIEALEDMIRNLREMKWEDDIDDVDSEDLLDNKQVLLSQDDPSLLQEKLNDSLHKTYLNVQDMLSRLSPSEDKENRSQRCCFLLRTWRELGQHLPHSYQNTSFGLTSIADLHKANAEEVLRSPLEKCSERFQRIGRAGTFPARSLWEGDPQLPVLPSPWTYRLLLDLAASMTACGGDIWTPQATNTLKKILIARISPLIEKLLEPRSSGMNGQPNGHTNGVVDYAQAQKEIDEVSVDANEGEEIADTSNEHEVNGSSLNSRPDEMSPLHDLKIQILFDTNYLNNATATKDSDTADNEMLALQAKLEGDLVLEKKSVERIRKQAEGYWKRTSLLFGLLA